MPFPYDERREALGAALQMIRAENYASESDPWADAQAEMTQDSFLLACQRLVRAIDQKPKYQPPGWLRGKLDCDVCKGAGEIRMPNGPENEFTSIEPCYCIIEETKS